ncbi:MAG: adenylate/guanylate cyclase domain-containing protein [Chloroflexi bacterium]|nr:adenylate/guanylate cyclase domain-containing protein [Chloroflexota bacterium]
MTRKLRLWSGLVLFVFVGTHLLNHSLGIFSLDAAELGRLVMLAIWRNPVGTVVLYGAFLTHIVLVLQALYRARHLRLPRWELVRLGLGLAMPFMLIPHIFGTRILNEVTQDFHDTYAYVVFGMWVEHPSSAAVQALLLVIAWTHGCMGVRWWLQFKPWYPRYRTLLRAGALLLPALALAGFAGIGRETALFSQTPGWIDRTFEGMTPAQNDMVLGWAGIANGIFVASVVLAFAARYVRQWLLRRRGVVRLTYPGGRRVNAVPGMTVLDASRSAGIPHASLCGGKGRCSTCRSRIGPASAQVPPPTPDEERVLRRVGAPPNVRLACQLRPVHDLNIIPLLPPTIQSAESVLRPSSASASEQEIGILFADIRGFTKFSEHRLPYDVVFVMNEYFKAMGEAVEASGGHLDKFIGDGVMALFGVGQDAVRGCRQALDATVAMAQALDELNRVLAQDLAEPLRIGIGIHVGHVIVGEMGYGRARTLTALGDAVNTASRLESASKEYKAQLIVSEDLSLRAGIDLSGFVRDEMTVRGRTTPMGIFVVPSALDLIPILTHDTALASSSVGPASSGLPRPPVH